MSDIELGTKVIEDDIYLDEDETKRLHLNGNNLEIQIKDGDTWYTYETLGS